MALSPEIQQKVAMIDGRFEAGLRNPSLYREIESDSLTPKVLLSRGYPISPFAIKTCLVFGEFVSDPLSGPICLPWAANNGSDETHNSVATGFNESVVSEQLSGGMVSKDDRDVLSRAWWNHCVPFESWERFVMYHAFNSREVIDPKKIDLLREMTSRIPILDVFIVQFHSIYQINNGNCTKR